MQLTRRFHKSALYSSIAILIGGFIYFGLLADAFYNDGDQKNLSALSAIAPSLPVQTGGAQQSADRIVITQPFNGANSTSQTLAVEGRAPANSTVTIYLNGRVVQSTIARNSSYSFPGIMLTEHANVLQTRYYSQDGSSDASAAILIFYDRSTKSN